MKSKSQFAFKQYDNVEDFYKDDNNQYILRVFISNYFKRPVHKQDREDMISYIIQKTVMYKTLERYDPKVSNFYTYFSNHVRFSLGEYYKRFINKDKKGYSFADADIKGNDIKLYKEDRKIGNYEAVHDFMAFIRWYKKNAMFFQVYNHYNSEKSEKIDNIEVEIIKHRLNGLNQTEIAKTLNLKPKTVFFYIKKMHLMYRIFIKLNT